MHSPKIKLLSSIIVCATCIALLPTAIGAVESTNYGIPQFQIPSGGVETNSNHLRLRTTTGPISGVATSTNYQLDTAFPAVTGVTISLSLDSASVNLGNLTPGTPITGTTTSTIATNSSAGHVLAIQKEGLMEHTDGITTITDATGTIAIPTTYTAGVDTGLGFTVSAGTSVESKWGTGTKYAAIPTQLKTTYHSLIQSISTPNVTTISYILDVPPIQKPGSYSTSVAIFATPLP